MIVRVVGIFEAVPATVPVPDRLSLAIGRHSLDVVDGVGDSRRNDLHPRRTSISPESLRREEVLSLVGARVRGA